MIEVRFSVPRGTVSRPLPCGETALYYIHTQRNPMTTEFVLTKVYKWMVISTDGLLKMPKDRWDERIFRDSYPTEEEAVADYQRQIDNDGEFPWRMVLIPEYEVKYVV